MLFTNETESCRTDGQRQRTLDLRLRHGIHALEMHLLFEDLGRAGAELNGDVESSCSSFGRIVRIARCNGKKAATWKAADQARRFQWVPASVHEMNGASESMKSCLRSSTQMSMVYKELL